MARVLLTGASGFLGSHLLKELSMHGDEIAVLVHQTPVEIAAGTVATANLAISSTSPSWTEQVIEFAPHVIVHAATRFLVHHHPSEITKLIQSNIELGVHLLEIAQESSSRIITFSSAWQHFQGASYSPVNLYAATKQAFDDICVYYQDQGLDLVRLTLFDVYGPHDPRPKLVPSLVKAAKSRVPMDASSGTQLIDLTYVDDVVRAVLSLLPDSRQLAPADWVVRTAPVSIRHVAQVLSEVTGFEVPVRWGAIANRQREMKEDWEFGQTLVGWIPQVTLRDGLKLVWQSEGAL